MDWAVGAIGVLFVLGHAAASAADGYLAYVGEWRREPLGRRQRVVHGLSSAANGLLSLAILLVVVFAVAGGVRCA